MIGVDLLHAQAVAGPSTVRDEISMHGGVNAITKPALGNEFGRIWVGALVGVHEVGGHADGDLLRE